MSAADELNPKNNLIVVDDESVTELEDGNFILQYDHPPAALKTGSILVYNDCRYRIIHVAEGVMGCDGRSFFVAVAAA